MRSRLAPVLAALATLAALVATPAPAARAQAATSNAPAAVQRQGIAEFALDPKGNIEVRLLDSSGTVPLPVKSASLGAIGDEYERGRRIAADLHAAGPDAFTGTLNLPEGDWNLDLVVDTGRTTLRGNFVFHKSGASSASGNAGRFPLVPPNPVVNRLAVIVAALIGGPVALGLIVVAWSIARQGRARAATAD